MIEIWLSQELFFCHRSYLWARAAEVQFTHRAALRWNLIFDLQVLDFNVFARESQQLQL